jgi:MFS family permease
MEFIRVFAGRTFSSFAIRNYRIYFTGLFISFSGTWMQTVALGWLVLTLTGSGSQLGLVIATQFLPILFLGPWGGVIVDRLDKRRILFWTQVLAGTLSIILSALIFTDLIQVWMVYLFGLGLGLSRVFENPARQTFINEIVGEDHLKNAISLNATSNNLARAIGPSIGGIVIATIGIAFCFLINALSYLALIIALRNLDETKLLKPKHNGKGTGELLEGFRYVRDNPFIRNILIMMAVIGTFAYEFQVSLPILAKQTFLGNASDYAALMAAFGVGSAFGGIFSAGRHEISPSQFVFNMFLFGVSILGTALSPSLTVATIGMVIVGFFSIQVLTMGNTMLQLEAFPQMRGRVMALWSVAMIGSTPIGGPIIGFIGEHFGARWALALGGTATVCTALFAFSTFMRKDRAEKFALSKPISSEDAAAESLKVQ